MSAPVIDPLAILLGAALAAARNDLEKQQAVACHQHVLAELHRLRQELEGWDKLKAALPTEPLPLQPLQGDHIHG